MILAYLALAYAVAGFAVFVHLLAYNIAGAGSRSLRLVDEDWTTMSVAIAVVLVLAFCLLAWPYAVFRHRRNASYQRSRRARSAWMG